MWPIDKGPANEGRRTPAAAKENTLPLTTSQWMDNPAAKREKKKAEFPKREKKDSATQSLPCPRPPYVFRALRPYVWNIYLEMLENGCNIYLYKPYQ